MAVETLVASCVGADPSLRYLLTDNVSAALKSLFDDLEKGMMDGSKKIGKKHK